MYLCLEFQGTQRKNKSISLMRTLIKEHIDCMVNNYSIKIILGVRLHTEEKPFIYRIVGFDIKKRYYWIRALNGTNIFVPSIPGITRN